VVDHVVDQREVNGVVAEESVAGEGCLAGHHYRSDVEEERSQRGER
jgi:hypothetical protein